MSKFLYRSGDRDLANVYAEFVETLGEDANEF